MKIDVATRSSREIYEFLVRIVTPRPIAWVTTLDSQNQVNLAPFSFYNVFGSNPPVVVFSPNLKRDGSIKDTLANVRTTGEFVVNSAVAELAEQMNLTAKELPPGQSEAELAGLELIPSTIVRPPRVARSPVQMECKVLQILPIGSGAGASNLVIGEVIVIHVADAVLNPQGQIDPRKLQTIGRLGGEDYCKTLDIFALKRP